MASIDLPGTVKIQTAIDAFNKINKTSTNNEADLVRALLGVDGNNNFEIVGDLIKEDGLYRYDSTSRLYGNDKFFNQATNFSKDSRDKLKNYLKALTEEDDEKKK